MRLGGLFREGDYPAPDELRAWRRLTRTKSIPLGVASKDLHLKFSVVEHRILCGILHILRSFSLLGFFGPGSEFVVHSHNEISRRPEAHGLKDY